MSIRRVKQGFSGDRICPACKGLVPHDHYWILRRSRRDLYFCGKGHLENYLWRQGWQRALKQGLSGSDADAFAGGWMEQSLHSAREIRR